MLFFGFVPEPKFRARDHREKTVGNSNLVWPLCTPDWRDCALCEQKIDPKRDQAIRNIKGYSALVMSQLGAFTLVVRDYDEAIALLNTAVEVGH